MNEAQQIIEYFERSDQANLPVMRLALRASLHSDYLIRQVVTHKGRLFRILCAGIVWPNAFLFEIWNRIYSREAGVNLPPQSDLPALLQLCAKEHEVVREVCRSLAVELLGNRIDLMRRILEVSLCALEYDGLCGKGQLAHLAFARQLYALDPLECRILEVAALTDLNQDFRGFLTELPLPNKPTSWDVLAAMVGAPVKDVQRALGPVAKLQRSGLVALDSLPDNQAELISLGRVGWQMFFLNADSAQDLRSAMLVPLPAAKRTRDDFPHLVKEFNLIVRGLCRHPAVTQPMGLHILVHGVNGSGKSELVRLLLKESGREGFSIQHLARTGLAAINPDERIERIYWAQALLGTHPAPALVVEHIEGLEEHSSLLLLEVLEQVTVPTLCICDDAERLGPAVLQRFSYHLEVKSPPVEVRARLAAEWLSPKPQAPWLGADCVNYASIQPAQIHQAARFTALCTDASESPEALAAPFREALHASNRAQGRSLEVLTSTSLDDHWDIDTLCLESSAPMSRILSALKQARGASLAFHGVPGTGKTSLARYISRTLGRPLLVKRVSDLTSKWIGETEKALADMFQHAKAEDAVLLLDEGDSFLRDRKLARHSWEITQVNELLQQMESHPGIFICATNLMDDIDTAALRRFTFKVRFLPLDLPRRSRMFAQLALGRPEAQVPPAIAARLGKLDQLAPGDFATIRRQENVLNERFDAATWIAELEREHNLRQGHHRRPAGFV